jgi:hypothetical protein
MLERLTIFQVKRKREERKTQKLLWGRLSIYKKSSHVSAPKLIPKGNYLKVDLLAHQGTYRPRVYVIGILNKSRPLITNPTSHTNPIRQKVYRCDWNDLYIATPQSAKPNSASLTCLGKWGSTGAEYYDDSKSSTGIELTQSVIEI